MDISILFWPVLCTITSALHLIIAIAMDMGDISLLFLILYVIGVTTIFITILRIFLDYIIEYGICVLYLPVFCLFIIGVILIILNIRHNRNNEDWRIIGLLLTSITTPVVLE